MVPGEYFFDGDDLRWYRVFSLSPRPRRPSRRAADQSRGRKSISLDDGTRHQFPLRMGQRGARYCGYVDIALSGYIPAEGDRAVRPELDRADVPFEAFLRDGLGEPASQVGEPTYAHKLTVEEMALDWNGPAVEIHRRVRVGGAWTTCDGARLKVWRTVLLPDAASDTGTSAPMPAGVDVPAGELARLSEQLRQADTPVKVALASDNATEVQIYRIGKLGLFEHRDLELMPGRYTVVGTRQGYRDVRKELNLLPSAYAVALQNKQFNFALTAACSAGAVTPTTATPPSDTPADSFPQRGPGDGNNCTHGFCLV